MKVVHWLLAVAVAWWLRQGGAPAMPGDCGHRCGDVVVPYPFGLDTNCARSKDFLLNCTNTGGSGVQLLWGNSTIRRISVGDSTMVVSLPKLYKCYDQNGELANQSVSLAIDLSSNPRYILSETQNKLTVLGCDTLAVVSDSEGRFRSGCISYCSNNVSLTDGTTCSGKGCCQASIPEGLKTLNININSTNVNASASQFNRCALSFVADNKSFNASNWTLPRLEDVGKSADLVVNWIVEPDVTCKEARQDRLSYACGDNTDCQDFGGPGYRCVCKTGHEGNPYNRRQGCTDINECKDPKRYPCHGKCRNTDGSYKCDCRPGRRGNPKKDRCKASPYALGFGVMAASFFGITITTSVSITWKLKLRKLNLKRNGGEFLKLKRQRVQIYTEAELAEVTNDYDDNKKLGDDGFSSVHKGKIKGEDVVVVKKPKDVQKSQVNEGFQDEVETLMKIRHENLVELRGICLETTIPLLVYKYIPNCKTLFDLISQKASTIPWEHRLRIATEAALALNYMHSLKEIVHGNIKSANILLDKNGSVKLSDFGTSVLILQVDKRIVATQKPRSSAYIDPEYWITDRLTIQSDVYSFGVVLVELLTGEIVCGAKSGEPTNNIHRFISSVKEKHWDVENNKGDSEDEKERISMVAKIAVRCLAQSGADRPTMSEVAQQLDPSSIAEEKNEVIEGDDDASELLPKPGEGSQDWMSSCLSCLVDYTS